MVSLANISDQVKCIRNVKKQERITLHRGTTLQERLILKKWISIDWLLLGKKMYYNSIIFKNLEFLKPRDFKKHGILKTLSF